jgi:hypothetical protein
MIDNTKGPDGVMEISGLTLEKILACKLILDANDLPDDTPEPMWPIGPEDK